MTDATPHPTTTSPPLPRPGRPPEIDVAHAMRLRREGATWQQAGVELALAAGRPLAFLADAVRSAVVRVEEVVPAWVRRAGLEQEFVAELRRTDEHEAAALCRRLRRSAT